MPRFLVVVASLGLAGLAAAQCPPWYPAYPVAPPGYLYSPALWGAPAPRPLPPALPRFTPRVAPGLREEPDTTPPAKPADKAKEGTKTNGESKDKDAPRIPKTKLPVLPGDPLDKSVPEVPKRDTPKSDGPKTDAATAKAFDQYVIAAEGRGESRAQVKVGFFNHTEREVVLDVNGEPVRIPKDEFVTLRLPRTFTWAERGAKGHEVVVPPDADGIEIVFRK